MKTLFKEIKKYFNVLIYDIFIFTFLLLFVFTFLEINFPGLVSNYLNINIILSICLLSLIFILFFYKEPFKREENKSTIKQKISLFVFIGFLAIVLAAMVYIYALRMGKIALFLSILTFISIIVIMGSYIDEG